MRSTSFAINMQMLSRALFKTLVAKIEYETFEVWALNDADSNANDFKKISAFGVAGNDVILSLVRSKLDLVSHIN